MSSLPSDQRACWTRLQRSILFRNPVWKALGILSHCFKVISLGFGYTLRGCTFHGRGIDSHLPITRSYTMSLLCAAPFAHQEASCQGTFHVLGTIGDVSLGLDARGRRKRQKHDSSRGKQGSEGGWVTKESLYWQASPQIPSTPLTEVSFHYTDY